MACFVSTDEPRVCIVAIFIKDNVPDKNDIEWFKRGGGGRGSSYYGSSRSPSVLE
jgi:cytochrome b subunit of formate dehydrogenase